MKAKNINELEQLVPFMSQWDLCEYWKELCGIQTGHFTHERLAGLKILSHPGNEEIMAHFWLLSNVN